VNLGLLFGLIAAAIALGAFIPFFVLKRKQGTLPPEEERRQLIAAARSEAEQIKRNADLEAQRLALQTRQNSERELRDKRSEFDKRKS